MSPRGLAPVSLVLALTLAGCTMTTALDVGYPEQGANRALLASAGPRRVQIGDVVDHRMETARVGTKAKDGGDIVTSRSVVDIVREALGVEMSKNRHVLVSDRPDVLLTAAVEVFRLDTLQGYRRLQYVGEIIIALTVADGSTGDTLLTRRYVGIRRRDVDKPDESQWREVLDTALARAMHDLATDPALVAAVGGSRAPSARPAT